MENILELLINMIAIIILTIALGAFTYQYSVMNNNMVEIKSDIENTKELYISEY